MILDIAGQLPKEANLRPADKFNRRNEFMHVCVDVRDLSFLGISNAKFLSFLIQTNY